MKKMNFLAAGLLFIVLLRYSSAWTGLVAENGDYITVPKWNELVTLVNTKLARTELLAGDNITITSSGSELTISSPGVLTAINTNREDGDLTLTRYYGTEYSDNSWKIDKETGTGTGVVRTTATNENNAGFIGNYSGAWTSRTTLTY